MGVPDHEIEELAYEACETMTTINLQEDAMIKLSEAILLGIGAVREERLQYLNLHGFGGRPGVCGCAIGTALYAVGCRIVYGRDVPVCYTRAMEKLWPWTKTGSIVSAMSLRHIRGETRESIAAWIATIEPQDESVDSVLSSQEELQHVFTGQPA